MQIKIEKGNRPHHAEEEKSMFAFSRVILVSGFWPLISLVGVTRPWVPRRGRTTVTFLRYKLQTVKIGVVLVRDRWRGVRMFGNISREQ